MHATTPLNELITSLALLGWEFKGLKVKNGTYVASAKNPQSGQNIERTGNSPEMAVHAVFQYAQRANSIRAFAKARQNNINLLQYVYGGNYDHAQEIQVPQAAQAQAASSQLAQEAAKRSLGQEVNDLWWPEWEDIDEVSQNTVIPHQGYRDQGLIEGAVGNARQAQSYGAHGDVFDTAADIIAKVQRQQAVVEGNKRTATALGLHWLQQNGYDVSRVDEEPYWSELVEAIWMISDAADPLGQEAINKTASILRQASVPYRTTSSIRVGEWVGTTINKLSGFYFWSADIAELARRQRETLLNREDIRKLDHSRIQEIDNLLEGTPDQGYKFMPWAVREWKRLTQNIDTWEDQIAIDENIRLREGLGRLMPLVAKWAEYARTYNKPLPEINNKEFTIWKMRDWLNDIEEEEAVDPRRWKDSRAIFTFPNGWYIAEVGADDLEREGKIMQHCVGGGEYCGQVADENLTIYSLREPNGQPHVTMSATGHPDLTKPPSEYPSVAFPEIFGKQDRPPVEEYQEYIRQWWSHLTSMGWYPEQGEGELPEPEHERIENAEGPYIISDVEDVTDFGIHMRVERGYHFDVDEDGEYDEGDNTYYYQDPRQIQFTEFPNTMDPDAFANLLNLFLNELTDGSAPEENHTPEDALTYIQDLWMLANMVTRQRGYQTEEGHNGFWASMVAPVLKTILEQRMYHQPQEQAPDQERMFDPSGYDSKVFTDNGRVMRQMYDYIDVVTQMPTEWIEEYEQAVRPGNQPEGVDWNTWRESWPIETRQRNVRINWPGEGGFPRTDFSSVWDQLQTPALQAFSKWIKASEEWQPVPVACTTTLTNPDNHVEFIPDDAELRVPDRQKEKVGVMTNPDDPMDVGEEGDPFSTPGGIGGGVYGYKIVMVDATLTLRSPQQTSFFWAGGGNPTVADQKPTKSSAAGLNFVSDGKEPVYNKDGELRMFNSGMHLLESYKQGNPWVLLKCKLSGTVQFNDDGARAERARIVDIFVPDGVIWFEKHKSEDVAKALRQKYVADVTVKEMGAGNYRVNGWEAIPEDFDLSDGWTAIWVYNGYSGTSGITITDNEGTERAVITGNVRNEQYEISSIWRFWSDGTNLTAENDPEAVEHVKNVIDSILKGQKGLDVLWADDAEQGRDQDHVESTVNWDAGETYPVVTIGQLIKLWRDEIQQNEFQFTEFTPGDSYSDTEWVLDSEESPGTREDEFGLPLWFLVYTEYPPTTIGMGPDDWHNLFKEAIDSLYDDGMAEIQGMMARHTPEQVDMLAQAFYGVPAFMASGEVFGGQFQANTLQAFFEKELAWGIQYATTLVGRQMTQEETLFPTDQYGTGIGLQANPKLNRFFNLLQHYITNSKEVVPRGQGSGQDGWTRWNDPETPEWGRQEIQLPGTFAKTADRDPDYLFVYYKSELRVERWDHNRKHADMLRELFDEFGRDMNNQMMEVNPDETAAGIIYEYSDGTYKVEHEQLNDPEIREYAEDMIDEWFESWVEVKPTSEKTQERHLQEWFSLDV